MTAVWPFLVSPGRRLGLRAVLAPDFLARERRTDVLTAALRDSDPEDTSVQTRVVRQPDGSRLAVAFRRRPLTSDATVRVYSPKHRRLRYTLTGHTGRVVSCDFSPDGGQLLTTAWDHTARLWRLGGDEPVKLAGHKGWLGGGVIAPDGRGAYTTSWDGTVRRWDLATGAEVQRVPVGVALVSPCAIDPAGTVLAVGGADHRVHVVDLRTGTLRGRLTGHTDRVTQCAIAPDGRTLASASWDGTVRVWDLVTGSAADRLAGHDGWVTGCAFGPHGEWIASTGWDGTARVWGDSAEPAGRVVAEWSDPAPGCAVHPRGGWLAVPGRSLRIAALPDGAPVRSIAGPPGRVEAVAVSPDGRLVATTSADDGPDGANPVRDGFGRPITLVEGFAGAIPEDPRALDWERLHARCADALGHLLAAEPTGLLLESRPEPPALARRARPHPSPRTVPLRSLPASMAGWWSSRRATSRRVRS
ncbi:WD40 repeat domain-containing protein [Dactylosporangium sp. CA-139114]|uniref:WD40 repeat domain-containing protein n=1 Tax=Dactylosporangium sp. CA-139114 TaxID=3239931 RepID=UPI003D95B942